MGSWKMVGMALICAGLGGCIFSVDGEGYVEGSQIDPLLRWVSPVPEALLFLESIDEVPPLVLDFRCAPLGCEVECGLDGNWRRCSSGEEIFLPEAGTFEVGIRPTSLGRTGPAAIYQVEVRQGIDVRIGGLPSEGETEFGYLQGLFVDCFNLECSRQCEIQIHGDDCPGAGCTEAVDCSEDRFAVLAIGQSEVELTAHVCAVEAPSECTQKTVEWDIVAARWREISAHGDTACGILSRGGLACWGANDRGQLGLGVATGRMRPTRVAGFWRSVAVGDGGACGIDDEGAMWCWGDGRLIPDGGEEFYRSPRFVHRGPWTSVSVGQGFACGLYGDEAELFCWGDESQGRLGRGTSTSFDGGPLPVNGPRGGWEAVEVGGAAGCGLRQGELWCWGKIPGKSDILHSPSMLNSPHDVFEAVAISETSLCAIGHESNILCYDEDSGGVFAPLQGADFLESLALGPHHGCGLTIEGIALCWGENSHRQLGQQEPEVHHYPTPIEGLSWADLTAGQGFTCGIEANTSDLYCWGDNSQGQLGNPDGEDDLFVKADWGY